jgi:hypothetical protein
MESALLKTFRAQVKQWLAFEEGRRWPYNAWISAKQGKIYVRFNAYSNTLTLANFVIRKKYWGHGIARSIIHEAIAQPVKIVRIESIGKVGWFERLKHYTFPGYETKITDQGNCGIQYDIDFIRL